MLAQDAKTACVLVSWTDVLKEKKAEAGTYLCQLGY